MALKALLDNLDGLPADVAKEYTKGDDGKFRLQVTPVGGLALEDVEGLRTALGKERENVRKASESLAAFKDIDPSKARDALAKVGEMANWTPEQKVKEQIEAVKAQIVEAHGKEKATLEKRLAGYQKQLTGALITAAATAAIAGHKGIPELLLPHVERQTRMRESDNGQFVVEVIDKDGNPQVDGKGNAMSIEQLVEKMKSSEVYARAFDGSGAKGSGATNGGGGSGAKGSGSFKISSTDAKDTSKYRAAREAAEKAGQPLEIADV